MCCAIAAMNVADSLSPTVDMECRVEGILPTGKLATISEHSYPFVSPLRHGDTQLPASIVRDSLWSEAK